MEEEDKTAFWVEAAGAKDKVAYSENGEKFITYCV